MDKVDVMVRSLVKLTRMAGMVRRLDPARRHPQSVDRDRLDVVVTQWTYESITVVTTGWDETGAEQARLTPPAGARVLALPAPAAPARRRGAFRALLRPQGRGGRLARAAFFAAGLIALPIVAPPVRQLLLGRRDLPRLPRPAVRLLPPATDGQ